MNQVFLDTSGFFAALSPTYRNHDHASALLRQATDEKWQLVTTNVVVFEAYALFLARAHGRREAAIAFLDIVLTDSYTIARVELEDELRAVALVRAHQDKSYSLV